METLDLLQRRARVPDGVRGGEFSLRRLDLHRDLDLMHYWMNDAQVAQFWEKAWPRDRIASYLTDQLRSTHSVPYLGVLDGLPMSYWELYRADLDPLAEHYCARERDAGVHLLLGPTEHRGRGLAAALLRSVSGWLLDADSRAARVVGEPDIENLRSVRTFERAGFSCAGNIDLPNKRAALMVRDRSGC